MLRKIPFFLFSIPLETYLEYKNIRTINDIELIGSSTNCYRGYIATWEIRNDSLFLIKVVHETELETLHTFNLKEEFGAEEVFASWFTGTLYSPRGKILKYVHMGFSSIFEKEEYYHVWNGKVKITVSKNNLVYDKKLLYPAESFLRDTLRKIIRSKFHSELLNEIPDSASCVLMVEFNCNGKVESVKLGNNKRDGTLFGETLIRIAKEEFDKLPPLAVMLKYNRTTMKIYSQFRLLFILTVKRKYLNLIT